MSLMVKGDLTLDCSQQELVKMLVGIMPDWERALKVDTGAGLTARAYERKQSVSGCSVIIPNGSSGVMYGDIGFKLVNGEWEVHYDSHGLHVPGVQPEKFSDALKGKLGESKANTFLEGIGAEQISVQRGPTETRIKCRISRQNKKYLMQ